MGRHGGRFEKADVEPPFSIILHFRSKFNAFKL